jgi:catechol-2,3-dioxygenase
MTAPSKFAHVVYNTHRYDEMIAWYLKIFEARVQHRDDRLAFLTYDDEHHRFAFANLGPLPADAPKPRMGRGPGVNHVAYTWADLGEFVALYQRLKGYGIVPVRPVKHGLTLSMYYADPDGNLMEFQIDVLEPDAANAFMAGPAFEANPIGEPFDPDELAARFEAGEPVDEVIFRSDQVPVPLAGPAR